MRRSPHGPVGKWCDTDSIDRKSTKREFAPHRAPLTLSLSPFSPSFLSIIAILVIYRRYERVLFLQFVILNPFFSFLSGQYPALLHSMMLERREKRIELKIGIEMILGGKSQAVVLIAILNSNVTSLRIDSLQCQNESGKNGNRQMLSSRQHCEAKICQFTCAKAAKYLALLCAKLQRLIRSRCRRERRPRRRGSCFIRLASGESTRILKVSTLDRKRPPLKNRSREGNKIHWLLRWYLAAQPNRHSFWKRGPKLPSLLRCGRGRLESELYQMTVCV